MLYFVFYYIVIIFPFLNVVFSGLIITIILFVINIKRYLEKD